MEDINVHAKILNTITGAQIPDARSLLGLLNFVQWVFSV